MQQSDTFYELQQQLGKSRVKRDFVLAPYTTFKMGGPAEFYFEAETDADLVTAVKASHELNVPLTIIGGVSNVVISDKGLPGLVVRNRALYKAVEKETESEVFLKVSSGYPTTRLAHETAQEGWAGLEYHVGLPGSIGGAIYMNSKWYIDPGQDRTETYIGDCLVRARLIDSTGNIRDVERDYFQFAYDYSILHKTHEIIVWAVFKLKKEPVETTKARAQASLDYRKKTQPFGVATSGCFFRNINGESAGKLIDELGLKGYKIGGAQVSEKHANFILNTGNATTEDVQKLIAFIKEKAKKERGVDLQEEVILID